VSQEAALQPNKSTNVRFQCPSLLRSCFKLSSHLAPQLTSRIAARLFTYPHGPRHRSAREARWLRDAVPFRLACGNRSLAAWSWGDGPTVLLHHGWNGRGAQLGAFIKPLVAAGFSVVTYDAPAHGESPGRFTNGVELARTIAQVSWRLNGLHAIVAHSLGCMATGYALRQPLPVGRVVFVSPPADMHTYSQMFADTAGLTDQVHNLMRGHFETKLGIDWRDFSAESLAAADRQLRGTQTPLLVVHDRLDQQVPWQHGRQYHEVWERSQIYLTERLGHRRILRDEKVVQKVVDFLRDS